MIKWVIGIAIFIVCHLSAAFPISAQEPSVTKAVAPVFPRLAIAIKTSGVAIVEVQIDKWGQVISKSAVRGHPFYRKSALNAAQLWRFSTDLARNEKTRIQLTFVFTLIFDGTAEELTTVFVPPYQIEVKYPVPSHVDVNITPVKSKRKRPRISTNQDGATREITYGGCG